MSTDGQVYMLRSWETQLILLESVLHEVCFSSGWLKQVAHLRVRSGWVSVIVSQLIFSFFRPKLAIQQWQYCTGALFNPIHPGGRVPPPLNSIRPGSLDRRMLKKKFSLKLLKPTFLTFFKQLFYSNYTSFREVKHLFGNLFVWSTMMVFKSIHRNVVFNE